MYSSDTARRLRTAHSDPGVAVSPAAVVYGADVVSPWQTCASGPPPPVGRITCDEPREEFRATRAPAVSPI